MTLETLAPAPGTQERSMGSKIFLGKYRVSAEEMMAVGESSDRPQKYSGEEIDSGRKVAVETTPVGSLKKEVRDQLEARAIAVTKLNHINIHVLRDFGVQDDQLVYVTEDLEGTAVEKWVNDHGPMPLGPVLRIASQVVSALGVAASQQIVHHAINPRNLLLLPGEGAQGEWPLVKLLHFEAGTPRIGVADGAGGSSDKSLSYTSPEQLSYGIVDARSEIYSLGATMWFLLTGAPPSMGPEGLMLGQPADQTRVMPDKIRRLLAKTLSVNPATRPHDPLAFYLQLQECITEAGPRAPTSRAPGPPMDSSTYPAAASADRRIPMKVVVLVALLLVIAVVGALVLPGYVRHRAPSQTASSTGARTRATNVAVSPTPAAAGGPVVIVSQTKSPPPSQTAASALKVNLLSFTPMTGTPGGKDFKIATLSFRIEASSPVTVTEGSFYVDSITFRDGSAYKPPITLFIHTGVFLGPPGTKVEPAHPMERTIWLKSQENLFPNWQLAYDQTENATFRWTIAGQPAGGSVVRPLHKPWSSPRPTPEVRRAVPVQPE